jgi:hypothetical protein
MLKVTKNILPLVLLLSVFHVMSSCFSASIKKTGNNRAEKYALLIGGGTEECNNYESFYKNIEYVFGSLKKLGYGREDVTVLFLGGKSSLHPIVDGNATKKNFIDELSRFSCIMDTNDSLLVFRAGHGMLELIFEESDELSDFEDNFESNNMKCTGTVAVMNFPDGELSCFELQELLGGIDAKQIVIILNQCFCGQFAEIALHLPKAVVVTQTKEVEHGFHQARKTIKWKHQEWPFVKCFFDGFLQHHLNRKKQSVFDAFQYMLRCNPNIRGIGIQADRPLLKEHPKIAYGSDLKIGSVYIH